MKRWMKIGVIVGIIAVIGAIFVFSHLDKSRYNDGYVNGNRPGNLYNGGLFCEYNGTVYFSNPMDGFALYAMDAGDTDGHTAKKISDDAVKYINADENYIYYTRNNKDSEGTFGFLSVNKYSLCRIGRNGKNCVILDGDPSIYASLVGNEIYYLHYDAENATELYKVGINGEGKEKVSGTPNYTCSADGQFLYYAGQETDHNIYVYDTQTGSESIFLGGNYWMPILDGEYMYYLDLEQNYALCRVHLTDMEQTTVVNKRMETYNVYGDLLYYQTAGEAEDGLYCCHTDGTEEVQIRQGTFCDINITSSCVYFREYEMEDVYYCTPTNGEINVTVFSPETE